jgi:GAF domain-containing protein
MPQASRSHHCRPGATEALTAALQRTLAGAEAAAGVVVVRDDDLAVLRVVVAVGMEAALIDAWGTFPLLAPVPLADAARTGRPVFLASPGDFARRYPSTYPRLLGPRRSWASLPLAAGDVRAVLGLRFDRERAFDEEDRLRIAWAARACAEALHHHDPEDDP